MSDVASYRVQEQLRDGSSIEVRALRPDDEAGMLQALEQASPQSLQRRFFAMKRHFSDKERAYFMNVDFRDHVALVAISRESPKTIVAGGRYVVSKPGEAELAVVVIDAWQGRGLGAAIIRHLIGLARQAGLRRLAAEVLADNMPMLSVFRKAGFKVAAGSDPGTVHLVLTL